MLGDAWGRTRYVSRRSSGFSPNVDVYYCGEPQRAVVKVDLAGVALERGRDRGLRPPAGDRRRAAGAGDRGARLPADRDSLRAVPAGRRAAGRGRRRARQGDLRGRGAADRAAAARPRGDDPPGPDQGRRARWRARPVLEVVDSPLDAEDAIRADQPLPEALPVLPLRDTVTFPETLTPLAVGQERSIQLVNDVLGANRMLVMVASRDPENEEPGPERPLRRRRRRRRRPDDQDPRRHRCASSSRGRSGCGSATTSPSSPTWWRGSPSCPT